jgi:formate dehydrogenase assembly factor FdhD
MGGGITIAAFLRGDNVNVYTYPERIVAVEEE